MEQARLGRDYAFTFWVAPTTLVFKSVHGLTFDFDIGFEDAFEIEGIEKEDRNHWTIITQQGDIQLNSKGYDQYMDKSLF